MTTTTTTLPKVSFQKTDEDYSLREFGVFNLQARSYGFNDFSQFHRPKHYIQYIEPIDTDLARQVEYDMDEQDQEWLDSVNTERKKEQIDTVAYETFEIIMDRLEKEWFDLTKNIPKTDFAMPSEDSTCAICDDSEGENSNAIVFCDGCNLAVHQDCYGVPYIPEGQWLCRKCTVSPENPVSCVLCPNEGGAFKQTVTGDWVHLLCAIWVPETRVANEVFMEPITGVDKISKQRWKLKCSLCEIKEGACIQCVKASCFTAFHATCARKEKLLMPMKSTQGAEPVVLQCYCEKHLPKEQQDARAAALARERVADEQDNGGMLSKSARAYAKTYKPGPPIVPALIINRILNYIAKVQLRKRQEFVQLVARYWSLKREARRGAPLLKRLHLEPWTANGGNTQSDEDKTLKLELLCRMRDDLERVHELTTLARKRESRKQAQAMVIRDTVLGILAPFEHLLRDTFARIVTIDRTDYFRYPVNRAEVPDYFDIVKKPMYWSIIEDKINNHSYLDSQEFKDDIMLVIDNALLYNQPSTAYHKTANRIRSATQPIFQELDRRLATAKVGTQRLHDHPPGAEVNSESIGAPAHKTQAIGDLEPPLEFLKLFTSADAIKDDTDLILEKTPLDSLFSFELAKLKPLPPPKPKRDRKADLEQKRRQRGARAFGAQTNNPPYTRTRRAAAAAATTIEPGKAELGVSATPQPEPEQPPMVTEVDSRGLFKLFEKGWIFPPEQKRGGRKPVERMPVPTRPRKRAKTDYITSRLSVVSTAASDNQTLQWASPSVAESSTKPAPALRQPMNVSISAPVVPSLPLSDTFQIDGIQPKRVVKGPDGQIIVEVLDSPLIRKQKSKQKKEERKRFLEQQRLERLARAPVQAEGQAPTTPTTSISQAKSNKETLSTGTGVTASSGAGISRLAPHVLDGTEAESELSSLSDIGSEAVEAKEGTSISSMMPLAKRRFSLGRKTSVAPAAGVPEDLGAILPGQTLEGGTLVWAKAKTYPWWPAVVYESDDIRIPPQVKAEGEVMKSRGQTISMVQFFDKTRSWYVNGSSKSHSELDEELLSAKSIKQKWKTTGSRADCRAAYDVAMAEMETHSDIFRAEHPENFIPPVVNTEKPENVEVPTTVGEDQAKGEVSMTTATGEADYERDRAFTPESEEMEVDKEN
ncbi:bromodomain and PHD finger-containing protein 3 [Amanita muscaria]